MTVTAEVVVLRAVIRQNAGRQFHLAHLPAGIPEPDGLHEVPYGSVRAVCGAEIPDAAILRRRARYLCSRCRRESQVVRAGVVAASRFDASTVYIPEHHARN